MAGWSQYPVSKLTGYKTTLPTEASGYKTLSGGKANQTIPSTILPSLNSKKKLYETNSYASGISFIQFYLIQKHFFE